MEPGSSRQQPSRQRAGDGYYELTLNYNKLMLDYNELTLDCNDLGLDYNKLRHWRGSGDASAMSWFQSWRSTS